MRVILADDDPLSRRTLSDLLSKWGFDVIAAADGPEAWLILQRQTEPCMAILSARLPQLDGLEICRRLRTIPNGPKAHLFLLGTQANRDEVLKAVETIADDYIFKPCNPQELRIRLRLGRRMLELEGSVEKQGAKDPLTNTLNRDSAIKELVQELERAKRQHAPVTLILVGIDRFDRILETHGQSSCDSVLVEASRRIADGLRPYDSVGRFDTDEFIVILPNCDTTVGERQATRMCHALANNPMQFSQHPVFVTCSVGVAGVGSVADCDADGLVRRAIGLLAEAKSRGGNTVSL